MRLPEIWRAANAGDGSALRRLALALKPRAEAAGAARVSTLCDSLSDAAAGQGIAVAVSIEEPLRRAVGDTRAAIRAWIDGEELPPVAKLQSRAHFGAEPATEVGTLHPRAPVRVLLADDDPVARAAIAAMLRTAPWIEFVGTALGGQEIVDRVAAERPDVVLLDWMMPGGGGVVAARRIRALRPQTLIVGITSSDSLEALTEMITAGASCVVSKAASPDQLTQTIARALKASRAAKAGGDMPGARGKIHVDSPSQGASDSKSTPQSAGWLDVAGVEHLRNEFGSTEILGELLDLFGTQTPERLIQLQHAVQARDTAAVVGLAHQLKGGALTLAASRMAELCDELEGAARNGSLEGAAARLERIEVSFEHAYAGLRREFD